MRCDTMRFLLEEGILQTSPNSITPLTPSHYTTAVHVRSQSLRPQMVFSAVVFQMYVWHKFLSPPLTIAVASADCLLFLQVCDFIQRRDGHRADPDNIFLTNGASEAVRLVLRTTIRGPSDGVMVPVPQVRAFQSGTPFGCRRSRSRILFPSKYVRSCDCFSRSFFCFVFFCQK